MTPASHQPLVSVLMTVYNREMFIAEAIESVLASSFTNFELIIVDDVSTDNGFSIASDFAKNDPRISVYKNEVNLGDYPNRNRAAQYARGTYIKYLDSDDILYRHGLEVMVRAMEQFPEAGFGVSSLSEVERPYPVCITPTQSYKEHFDKYGHFDRAPGSVIFRRDVFEREGRFTPIRHLGDTELLFRLGKKYPMVKFPPDLYWSRTHSFSESARRTSSKMKNAYHHTRTHLVMSFLNAPDCPLSEIDKKHIKQVQRKNAIKKIIRKWL